ncbi:Pimeloyl-ACP methyl ester carboxylesterase [Saccharopolyspora antimicrobica]|uniref:Pimeloyl-ACP methyl ester carboxylesterase n=1 Tax=Saccharopolyspora antimicrobica TaxID=455193 RepID=A0A1I5B506_9PSEU|nr:alpha/beta hydrolase [Saccharopolyspora antimicrobica]RKT86466.1 pimeloyl-ACP methyl ester carboxylesterase [Saccharopolyspora antimicrobica]SFN69782.1 Pimeloyl-ACP methyl ester carboxylesterase [Saccharopolyspora antimicrobica]
MSAKQMEVPVSGGVLSGLDFGGRGTNVLLVHGSGHNAAVWRDVAAHLVDHCRLVAVDLRGHGQSAVGSSTPEQYWRDLGDVVAALAWERPVLVGHSTGGYAVTAATAAGLVEAAALCVVDGVVLDDRCTAALAQAQWQGPEAGERLREMFRYGWRADEQQMHDYVEQCVRESETDWLNAGSRPQLVREVMRRAFLPLADGLCERRPTTEEIATVSAPDPGAEHYPSVDVYDRIACPITFVLPDQGFYAQRRDDVGAVVAAAPDRELIEITGDHNVPMTRPAELAAIIRDLAPAA